MSVTRRARANADIAHPTRATGIENESAYWGSTGEIILTPSMTQPETSERFRITKSRCFIYKRPIICASHKQLSIIIPQRVVHELMRRKARKYPGIDRT
jgi:hypothetical protein